MKNANSNTAEIFLIVEKWRLLKYATTVTLGQDRNDADYRNEEEGASTMLHGREDRVFKRQGSAHHATPFIMPFVGPHTRTVACVCALHVQTISSPCQWMVGSLVSLN